MLVGKNEFLGRVGGNRSVYRCFVSIRNRINSDILADGMCGVQPRNTCETSTNVSTDRIWSSKRLPLFIKYVFF